MLIILDKYISTENLNTVMARLEQLNVMIQVHEEKDKKVIVVLDGAEYLSLETLEILPGVERIINIKKPYRLVSREYKPADTVVKVNGIPFGGENFQIVAGPCAVENEEQVMIIAKAVKEAGAVLLRGGAYKPRTSPYSFQGLEEEGLKLLAKAREKTGLPVVTEVLDVRDLEVVAYYADMIQIGARNMQNFPLLKEVARLEKPVLLKRGLSATIEEWLLAAEYIMQGGNPRIILCERGIRTFETFTRNTLDLSAVPAIKTLSHLPIIVDPSHGCGKWFLVPPLAKAACAVGAHGLMVEVHHQPSCALSDGEQSLTPGKFHKLMQEINKIKQCLT
ncbi:3-deoxy-7-phosphoheptulonate synthase [Thermanaerosceptrum fracticalcis]|uniref:3-deoxy-7-phosphoheptulonate synthase n=1 Tax=Thermanaerosceptrum fracticalcis TaxID=1712410 RepID=A0A7G6E0I9_THEFR|nr:3-deoxy-7-phosphoheptulonate synthase [Thermanaerosceptrum fracticalcis]QNB45593.1 3-deoxy-7-phosphoheptulonate synthase [Thermanaerosceptrum fracticalcis]